MKVLRLIIRCLLILVGMTSLLTYAFHLENHLIHNLWFLFILVPGLYFEMNYFQTKKIRDNLFQEEF